MPPTLIDEYNELRAAALAIPEEATKADRALTDEEQVKLASLVEEAKAKHADIESQRKATGLIEQAKGLHELDQPKPPEGDQQDTKADGRSFGERFVTSEGYKALLGAYPAGIPDSADPKMAPVQLGSIRGGGEKGLLYVGDNRTSAASTIPGIPQDWRGLVPSYFPNLNILDVITRLQTSSDLVEYMVEDVASRVNAAVPVKEATATSGAGYTASAKPESAVKFIRTSTGVKIIATWIPVTNKALADVPQLRSIIDSYLMRYLDEALANEIVAGDGTGEHFAGILNQATAHTPGTDTGFTLLRLTQADAEANGTPNAWLLNPADIAKIDTQKDTTNRFFGAGPFSMGPRTLWGLPVVSVSQVPAGTGVVGDFRVCNLYDREAASVTVGTINDQFTHNMRTLLAEERAAFGVLRPAALKKVAFTFP